MLYKPETPLEKIASYIVLFCIIVCFIAAIGYAFYVFGL